MRHRSQDVAMTRRGVIATALGAVSFNSPLHPTPDLGRWRSLGLARVNGRLVRRFSGRVFASPARRLVAFLP